MADAGRIVPLPQGEYDVTKAYEHTDIVTYDHGIYMCKVDCTGIPVTNTSYWVELLDGKYIKDFADSAEDSATNAKTSEDNAKISEDNAKVSETTSDTNAKASKSYAVGGTGTRTGEDTDNAKYYYEQAKTIAGGNEPDGKTIIGKNGKISVNLDNKTLKYDTTSNTILVNVDDDTIKYDTTTDKLISKAGHELVTTKADLDAITTTGEKVVEAFLVKSLINDSTSHSDIHIYTTVPEFEGLLVTATSTSADTGKTETVAGTITDGYCSLSIKNVDVTVTISVTYEGTPYTTTLDVPTYAVYRVDLVKESATIEINTLYSQLYDKTIQIEAPNGSKINGTLNSVGTVSKDVIALGNYKITCTDATLGSRVPEVTVNVDEFYKTFSANLEYNYATISVKTSEEDLLGQTFTVTDGTHTYTDTFPSTIPSGQSEVSVNIEVYNTGTYTVSCTSTSGDPVEESVVILNYHTTNDIELSLTYYFIKNGVVINQDLVSVGAIASDDALGSAVAGGSVSISQSGEYLTLDSTAPNNDYYWWVNAYFKNTIDSTKYSKLILEYQIGNMGSSTQGLRLLITTMDLLTSLPANKKYPVSKVLARSGIEFVNTSLTTQEFSVSGFSSSSHIVFAFCRSENSKTFGYIQIKNMYLTK